QEFRIAWERESIWPANRARWNWWFLEKNTNSLQEMWSCFAAIRNIPMRTKARKWRSLTAPWSWGRAGSADCGLREGLGTAVTEKWRKRRGRWGGKTASFSLSLHPYVFPSLCLWWLIYVIRNAR